MIAETEIIQKAVIPSACISLVAQSEKTVIELAADSALNSR